MSKPEQPGAPGGGRGGDRTDRSDRTDRADRAEDSAWQKGLRPSGGYRTLRSFRVTTVIYDATAVFCERFVDKRSRTRDQMVQAARSGRQNIAEGSRASATSSQTELRLVNVARASLDELLLDYEDFLRQRGLRQWGKDDPQARAVREVGWRINRTDQSDRTDRTDQAHSEAYAAWLTNPDPGVVANAVICLIHQANYLLDRQIGGLESQFIQGGGYSERLAAARIEERRRQNQTDPTDRSDKSEKTAPICPSCGRPMALRTARKGAHAGSQFWGCTGYPECKGTQRVDRRHR
jgi:restriction system protein